MTTMYGLTSEDLEIQARARTFTDELIPLEVTAETNGGTLPPDVVAGHAKRARELALHSTNMPADLGGGGCTTLQQVLVQEQVGRVTNALGWVAATPPSWLPAVATPYQIDHFVRPAIAGQREECYAITEEGAGSDVSALESTARRDGETYLLNGIKWHVTSFNTADFAFFQARLDGGPHAGEHAMFLVDLPSPGVSVVRTPAYSHTISHHHPIVAFTDVRVPAEHLIGAEGDGMAFAHEWFRFERLMVAARCLGAASRLTDEMSVFAAQRQVRGKPISEFGTVAAMLADSLTELFAARSMAYETARGIDRGNDVKIAHAQCSMAKLYCSEMAGRVADRAVQVFGGRGYMRENVAERFYRELRVERIWEGTSEVQRAIIAAQMVKRGPALLA
ncbi:MAG TPA: acyl-CoA dehydrogenase family protein [Streptosporangiaceae bacterium]|nr:acyl-CoA dehydrogenase family protein [Streptosporangiaceae bacterium]